MLIPYEVDVPFNHRPVTNWLLVIMIIIAFFLQIGAGSSEQVKPWILEGWRLQGIFGYMWLHGGIFHLGGNLLFLWVFGNAVCSKIGNVYYLPTYLLFGIMAGVTHLLLDSHPAIGASGAINGLIGMYIVFFPRNDINMLLIIFFVYFRTFAISGYWMVLMWFAFDIWGAMSDSPGVAYYCHIGGFAAGAGLAVAMLKYGIIKMERDEQSLLDLITEQRGLKKAQAKGPLQMTKMEKVEMLKMTGLKVDPRLDEQINEEPHVTEPKTNNYIRFACKCGMRIKVSAVHAGQKGKCPRCKKPVKIPYE